MAESLIVGLRAEVRVVVDEGMLAIAFGSGSVPVFATPALVGLLERAACEAVAGALPVAMTTVGAAISVNHLAPTPQGVEVRGIAELVAIDGRRLHFRLEAFDPVDRIADGLHERVIVDPERLLARARAKST